MLRYKTLYCFNNILNYLYSYYNVVYNKYDNSLRGN